MAPASPPSACSPASCPARLLLRRRALPARRRPVTGRAAGVGGRAAVILVVRAPVHPGGAASDLRALAYLLTGLVAGAAGLLWSLAATAAVAVCPSPSSAAPYSSPRAG